MSLLLAALLLPSATLAADGAPTACVAETKFCRLALGADGRLLGLVDLATQVDYAVRAPLASVHKAGKSVAVSALTASLAAARPGQTARLTLRFGDTGITAVIDLAVSRRYVTFEVIGVSDPAVDSLTFGELRTTLRALPSDAFAVAGLALNLQTNVPSYPQPVTSTSATCYPRFGLAGAKFGVCATPPAALREAIQEAVTAAPELPHSPLGGPWAMDAPQTRGSYLFNFADMSEDKVDGWIRCAQSIGFNQIDFHGGTSFRFGDFLPNPKTYPRGFASLKAVIDRLHASGIQAGLHTYAFFIDKRCPYVTPVPDPRLAKAATFTLAAPLTTTDAAVTVQESTAQTNPTTGFFVRNSATIQIDDELILFTGTTKTPPYTFTGCQRGALGTKVTAHAAGAKVGHLKECFGLFVPDPETTMLAEIAAKTAEIYNACGFDMIYLDALDGEDILGGSANSWHYGSQFVFEIAKRLKRPALMEMSTFHHHLWYVRSRLGAWDHPNRSHKRFIDLHCRSNEDSRRMFLSANLGWWALKTWSGAAGEPTFSDDIEYLCGKAIGYDCGLSLMGINPDNYDKLGALKQLGPILKQYEDLRHAGVFSAAMKAKLRVPGDEYTLVRPDGQHWQLQPRQYARHRVEGLDGWSDRWTTTNRFGAQPVQLRVQALLTTSADNTPGSVPVVDFAAAGSTANHRAAKGVTGTIEPSTAQVKVGSTSAKLTARSTLPARAGSWATWGKVFTPPLNLSATQALGLWIHGDGQGEVLNIQLESPQHIRGTSDHFVIVDFRGWRYVELIEPEAERHADYVWPYGDIYSIYREDVHFSSVETVNVWVNNLPPRQEITCYLSPLSARPLVTGQLTNPAITIGGQTLTFPVTLASGSYLEFRSRQDCQVRDPQGNVIASVTPTGEVPTLPAGPAEVRFSATAQPGQSARAYVWVIGQGEVVPEP